VIRSFSARPLCIALLAFAAGVAACEPEYGDPPAAPQTVVNQYIQYVTYVYAGAPAPASSGPGAPLPAGPAMAVSPASTPSATSATYGGACDALFTITTRCVESLTSDDAARSRFLVALEPARQRAADAHASGDTTRIAEVENACAASLSAYHSSPCAP
jgi:hypothetical protein